MLLKSLIIFINSKIHNIKMNYINIKSYNLTPDQYLQSFKNPFRVINHKGSQQQDQKDLSIISNILAKDYNDPKELRELKSKILEDLKTIITRWMVSVAQQTNNEMINFQIGYGMKVFGSFRLQTNSYDGDIDVLCIVPEYFSREKHFFKKLSDQFKKQKHFKEIFSIPDAIVPLMRLNVSGVQIDLLLSRIKQSFLKENQNFFDPDSITSHYIPHMPIHEMEIRSINGYRTAVYLNANCVEKYKNYRETLKAVKMWAKNKGIYSQIYGYLGGAAFSIMLAKICQLYPNYSCLQLLDRFFFIFANWVWTIPVIIEQMDYIEKLDSQMIIFTPLEPHMNAGHYISKITCNITRKQLKLAAKCIKEINRNQKKWTDLFKPFDFFSEYRNFLQISVMGHKQEDFIPWRGTVESKIRKLIQIIEQQQQFNHGFEFNPYPKQFNSKHPSFKNCSRYYIGIKCNSNSAMNDYCEIDLTHAVKSFIELLQKYPEINKIPTQINIGFQHLTRKNIPADVIQNFQKFLNGK